MTIPSLPGYRIVRSLSESKRAHVYLAEQQSLQRLVALKVLSFEVSDNPASRLRVIEEGKAAARLTHPNLLSVFDIGEADGRHYIATEYVSGGTLRDRLSNGGLEPEKALLIARDLVTGMKFLHSQGFLHRDIKPTNVMFREDGTALLGEAGVARAVSGKTPENEQVAFGSPHYMSPERAQALPSDGRSDQYSLGVVVWESLTGKPPFDADDPFQVAIKHITEPVPALPLALAWLQPILGRCLAKQPEQRFNSAAELLAAIDAVLAARGISTGGSAAGRFAVPVAPTNAPLSNSSSGPDDRPGARTEPSMPPLGVAAPASTPTQPLEPVPPPASSRPASAPQPPAQPDLAATAVFSPLAPPPAHDHGNATALVQPVPAPPPKAPPIPGATVVGQRLPMPASMVASETVALTPVTPKAPSVPAETSVMPMQRVASPAPAQTSMPPATPFSVPANAVGGVAPAVPFGMPSSTAATSAPMPTAPSAAYVSAKKSSGAAGWLIWIGVLGLLCAGAAAWWVLKGSKEQNQIEAPKPGANQVGDAGVPSSGAPASPSVNPASGQAPSTPPSSEAQTDDPTARFMQKAKAAYGNGDFVTPVGDCAAFYYAAALKLAPDDADAQLGMQSTADSAEQQIAAALQDGGLTRARSYLDAALPFFGDRESLKALKAKLDAAG
jgi:serine/threonine protein kinase